MCFRPLVATRQVSRRRPPASVLEGRFLDLRDMGEIWAGRALSPASAYRCCPLVTRGCQSFTGSALPMQGT